MTGEHLSPDIQQFIRVLQKHGVRYLLVGGEAVIHHGYPRLTGDVDFFYDPKPDNCRRLFVALEEFWGGPVPAVSSAGDLAIPNVVVQFGRPPNRIDLISTLGTVPFGRAWRRRVRETLRTRRGVLELPIIALGDLIQSKRDAGRYKDLEDVEQLTLLAREPRKVPGRARPRRHRRRIR